jgi:hypothetical protein
VKEHPLITEPLPAPAFGRDGEPCPACGAPLAGDQRYCLHCGARRPQARLEFLDVLDADVRVRSGGPLAVVPPPPLGPGVYAGGAVVGDAPPRGLNARLQANSGLLALSALLLLTLLIGLLLGHWVTSGSAPQAAAPAAPQVIKVEGAAAAPAATAGATATGAGGSGGAGGSTTPGKTTKSSGASDKAGAKAPKDAVPVKSLGDKKAIDNAVKKGKPITTGAGKLPPKDGKPAGNGTSFQAIG